jgi:salicylate synthase
MNNTAATKQSYFKRSIPITADPLILAGLLADSGLSQTYLIYEQGGKWFIGIGAAALLTVDAEKTNLKINGQGKYWQRSRVSDSISAALDTLPIEGWRAYGIANFEMARYNYELPFNTPDGPFFQLFVPRYEVRLEKGLAKLRALDKWKLETLARCVETMDKTAGNGHGFDQRIAAQKLEAPEIETSGVDIYQEQVTSAVDEIRARQYTKVILSRAIPLSRELDVTASYIAGRRANTPARSFLLNIDHLKAAGFSPETVVEVTKGRSVSTQPLAGTRALGADQEEEIRLRNDLLNDSKEIYEHAVSVQLAFEELRSVCSKDSVRITDFMSVSRRNTVQHLASRVIGQLKLECNAWHAFEALFPAVTATGIPKRESIEAIGRLESRPRDLYSGCVMIADSEGALDAALVLRTVFQKNKKAWLHVGAGIVEMSTPEREAEETREKIRSVSHHLVHA